MAGPFYNNIKSNSSGTAGTGAFTPGTATADGLAWSTVPTGWVGLVRYDDGTNWELAYGYWNGTTITRPSNIVASSTGSRLSLTSAATAALVPDGDALAPLQISSGAGVKPQISSTSVGLFGVPAGATSGTAAAANIATTNYLTEQPRIQYTSATTANAQAGYSHTFQFVTQSTTAGRGGWQATFRFGASQLPTGPRFFIGMTNVTFAGSVGEPSALVGNYAIFGKDSADTNLQLITNSNVSTGTKIDTGIALVANDWFHAQIWANPGSATIYALLVKLNNGSIFYTSTTADVPINGAMLFPQSIGGLSGTTGTAIVYHFGGYWVRTGGL